MPPLIFAKNGQPHEGRKELNMKKYKEIRTISAYSLRALCIRHDWYTNGDNDEYEHLLYDLAGGRPHLTTEDIIAIAVDIASHSDLRDGYDIEGIAWEVNRASNVSFREV